MPSARNMLSMTAQSVVMTPASTSYFSAYADELDPVLFDGMRLREEVRRWVLQTIHNILATRPPMVQAFIRSESWARIWIAGSGVSYQWEASRHPADLDILLGIDFVELRRSNPGYSGLTDSEITAILNQLFYDALKGQVGQFPFNSEDATYEVTAYVNRGVSNHPDGITAINPYAAYDATSDEWAVLPTKTAHAINPAWDMAVERDRGYAQDLVDQYGSALAQVQNAQNPAHRTNAETHLQQVMDAAAGLYDELHNGRRSAFGAAGSGYSDFHNYRWQAGKATGVVQAMKQIRQYLDDANDAAEFETYGMELPDTETLVRRSIAGF